MLTLIDTNVLLAYSFAKDVNHQRARQFFRSFARKNGIVPAAVLSELFQMTVARLDYAHAINLFIVTKAAFRIEDLKEVDMTRMAEIMRQYADAEFDYADVSIMAMSERLNITQVCTFDHRDFLIFRPKHCSYLTLLP